MTEFQRLRIEISYWIREMFTLKIVNIRLNMAIKKADLLCKINNKRYYVIPKPPRLKGGREDYVMCVTHLDIAKMKHLKIIPKNMGQYEISKKWEFYRTPLYRTGEQSITFSERMEMRKQYLKYQRLTNPILKLLPLR